MSLPPGRQPYDRFNGLRVGGVAGVLAGGGLTAVLGATHAWFIIGAAVAGGALGYVVEMRAIRRDEDGRSGG